jgi:hypothetical protein
MIFSEAEASDSGLSPIRMVNILTLLVSEKIRQTLDSNIVQKLDNSLWCHCVSFAFLVRHEKSEKQKNQYLEFCYFRSYCFSFLRSTGLLCDKMNGGKN